MKGLPMRVAFGQRLSVSLLALGCMLLAGCATRVKEMGGVAPGAASLPRPAMVVVDDFTVDPQAVQVDRGIGGMARRGFSGEDTTAAKAADAATVRDAVRDTLLKSIAGMGLPAQPASGAMSAGPYVEIRGDVLSVDEGNRTRRNIVGFGAGRSSIQAVAQVLYSAPGQPLRLLQSYDGNAESGRMPGLGLGAASAAAGAVAGAAVNTGAHAASIGHGDIDADARRLAEQLASKLGSLFAQQGWIAPSAAPSAGLR
jgi:hypothetical protein